jgi:hypothetical protein
MKRELRVSKPPKEPREDPRVTITTNINFDRDVWNWLNSHVAELKRSKPSYNKKEFIQDLVRREMAKDVKVKG